MKFHTQFFNADIRHFFNEKRYSNLSIIIKSIKFHEIRDRKILPKTGYLIFLINNLISFLFTQFKFYIKLYVLEYFTSSFMW